MFTPFLNMQAQLINSMAELTIANIQSSMEIASKLSSCGMEYANTVMDQTSGKAATKKEAKAGSPFANYPFPTTINYIPNLFKQEAKPAFPFTPMEMMEVFAPKAPANPLFPDFSKAMPPFTGNAMTPFAFTDALKAMQQNWPQAQSGPNLKAMMVMFEIPMDSLKPFFQFDGMPGFGTR